MKKILLDSGHGGHDSGAVSPEGFREEDIALAVVLKLGKILKNKKYEVRYTREYDIFMTPTYRLMLIKRYNPDCFVSVHCNAAESPNAHGIETIYRDVNDFPLATEIQNQLVLKTQLKDRGLKKDPSAEYSRNLAVLKDFKTPSCLVEIFFLSNEDDLEYYSDNKDIIAEALAEGINKYAETIAT